MSIPFRSHHLLRVGSAMLATALLAGVATTVVRRDTVRTTTHCSYLLVPAFFYPGPEWKKMDGGKHEPRVVILDLTDTGAGSGPVGVFQSEVRYAQKRGITVLGYSSTQYGSRPIGQVEADVRNYKAWYKVTGVFLDEGSTTSKELPYYRAVSAYIRKENPGAPIWLNSGAFPSRGYMETANVIMTFEGPYANYVGDAPTPAWVRDYDPRRFANNVYDTPVADWQHTLALIQQRHVGWSYVTDLTGSNPYSSLPSYWQPEVTDDASCKA